MKLLPISPYTLIGSIRLKAVLISFWMVFLGAYIVAFFLCIQLLLDSVSGYQREIWWMWIRGFYLVLSAIGALVFLYAWLIEPRWLEIRRVKLSFGSINGFNKRPLRIVHISDFHCEAEVQNETEIPERVSRLKPDIIVYTGDALNSPDGLKIFQHTMRAVSKIAPTFSVRGNWDEHYWRDIDLLSGTGVCELHKGKTEILNIRGEKVRIGGLLGGEMFDNNIFSSHSDEELRILLCHRPQIFDSLPESACHLVCVGHTHGGQVRLPRIGPVFTFSADTRHYVRGIFRKRGMVMNVNRGIGMEGGLAPRIRFLARPEMTLLIIS